MLLQEELHWNEFLNVVDHWNQNRTIVEMIEWLYEYYWSSKYQTKLSEILNENKRLIPSIENEAIE